VDLLFKGVGVDLVTIGRIEKIVQRHPERFLKRVFSSAELENLEKGNLSATTVAARFAAKEAVLKAIGCGIGQASLSEVEIVADPGTQPQVKLHGTARSLAGEKGIEGFAVSMTHEPPFACAIAVAY
jgi:holo-[acyl-carrier protein] synthase